MTYEAPLRDIRFVLQELIGLDEIAALPGQAHVQPELVDAVLEEAARFAGDVLAPLNKSGDRQGARWQDGAVTTPDGFAAAYHRFVEGGWNALAGDPEFGGQGLPATIAAAVEEMWHSANVAFALCPLLTRGAIEALGLVGTEAQKNLYLPKLIEGSWTGTMNLTEPQAGSDLAAVRTRAVPQDDGTFLIQGQKIFITYGEHDMAENIVHLVLARLPDAPEGVKGISLFLVPKFLPDAEGKPGYRNDVRCVSIEHKLGIHASPTAVLSFGDKGGAVGDLVGEANRGLEYMFVMMNAARFQVALQGLALTERAKQLAVAYARDRIQGTETGVRGGGKVAIIKHPDVRRMLMEMKARGEAMRALCYVTAFALDQAHYSEDEAVRQRAQARAELLIPVAKGWCTEGSVLMASLGVQVHGGMGFIEETGAAQHLRDARITPIYEGTTGIQANDLIGRKISRDGGKAAVALITEMRALLPSLPPGDDFAMIGQLLGQGLDGLARVVDWVVSHNRSEPAKVAAGAVPLLELFGIVTGGWQLARAAMAAEKRRAEGQANDQGFLAAKLGTARFFADHILSHAPALAHAAMHGASGVMALSEAQFEI
jgi:acyl-CoA dehydrogenase